jgi:hypothetical protein
MKNPHMLAAAIGVLLSMASGYAHAKLDCRGPAIKANLAPYSSLPAITNQDVGITDDEIVRSSVMTAVAGAYRVHNGVGTLPIGSTFKMVYKDGTRECGHVISRTGSIQVNPVPNSQREYAGPGEVEGTSWYINLFNRNQPQTGFFTVCWDYYTNGVRTDTECEVHRF